MTAQVSIGVAGALGPELIARLAPAIEDAGFHALWVNDTPGGDAIVALAAAARVTDRLVLATGVVPVDRRPADEIAREVLAADLPQERLLLGIGSGAGREGALGRVGDAVTSLRAQLDARVIVGGLGPRMRRIGAERADGVLLNWVPAAEAEVQAAALHALSDTAHVAVYVRTALNETALSDTALDETSLDESALDDAALDETALSDTAASRLAEETARYASYPAYAANFERMGVDAAATTFADEAALTSRLPDYRAAVDEVVLRAMTADDTLEAYLAFIARAAALAHLTGGISRAGG